MACQLVIKSTERKAPALQVDRSSDHLWGDVVDICRDGLDMSHQTPDPFLCINLPCDRDDVEYLLEPLTVQEFSTNAEGETQPLEHLLRKRFGLILEKLPTQKYSELLATGTTTVTVQILESIINFRGVE